MSCRRKCSANKIDNRLKLDSRPPARGVKCEGPMKAVATEDGEQSPSPTTHLGSLWIRRQRLYRTARWSLGLFQPTPVGFVGLLARCGLRLALDQLYSPGRRGRNSSDMACRIGQRRTLRSGSARATRRWRVPLVPSSQSANARRTRHYRKMIRIEHRYRGPQTR